MNYQLITQDQELAKACSDFADQESLSIDTEFKRETTYFPIPCLIQIGAAERTVCIDPFNINDFSPLKSLLCNERTIKIMHAGRQDMEVFHKLLDCIPTPVFDTQIAAALLGGSSQIGYSALVKQFFEIELDKSLTRTDWEKRPLSEDELLYAANDVKFLEPIYLAQKKELINMQRISWLKEETDGLFHGNSYDDSLEKVWLKMNHSIKLDQRQRNILFTLNQWREREASSRNRARQFIISNDILIGITLNNPQNFNQLKLIDKIPDPVINRYGDFILSVVNEDSTHQINIPEPETFTRLSTEQKQLMKDLKVVIQSVAKDINIEDSFLCNKSTLEKLVRGDKESKLFNGWRYDILGRKLETLVPSFNS